MTLNFNINAGVTVATVRKIAGEGVFFFAQNGTPGDIFCHCNQGGHLDLTPCGAIVLKKDEVVYPPAIDNEIVLIRESNDPNSPAYTKASRWVAMEDWEMMSWAVNAHNVYVAMAYNHHRDGKSIENNNPYGEVEIFPPCKLIDLIKSNPRGNPHDPLESGFEVQLSGSVLSYDVRWFRIDSDNRRVECADPRPTTTMAI